jgi:two-component system response regulator
MESFLDDITYILGKAVRARRNMLGISQEELGFRSKLHRTYVAHVERGSRNPSLRSIAKLAQALQLPLSTLLSDVQLPSDPPRNSWNREAERAWMDQHQVEILLAEDDANDAELAIHTLKTCNVTNRIHLARDGSEALAFIFCTGIYANRRMDLGPRVLLLDLGLPTVGGLEVLRRVRSDLRTRMMPVIVLTASRLEKDLTECRKLGVKDYIVKPIDFKQFSVTAPRLGLHWLLLNKSLRTGVSP